MDAAGTADEKQPRWAMTPGTILAAAAGAAGLLWLFATDSDITVEDTVETRKKTIEMLDSVPGLPGGATLSNYLKNDGFLQFSPGKVPNVGNTDPLVLGAGSGLKIWPHKQEALQSFNKPRGGIELRYYVVRALKSSPTGDDSASRQLAISWLQDTFVAAKDEGFAQLVQDLNAGQWGSGTYVEPPKTPQPSLELIVSSTRRSHRIIDYPLWLKHLTTIKLLDTVDKLAYDNDPTAEARRLIDFQIAEQQRVVGFPALAAALAAAGWNDHPLGKNLPKPGAVLIPQLGGLKNVDVGRVFAADWSPDGIEKLVRDALDSANPGFAARTKALASLKAVMASKTDPWVSYYEGFAELIYVLEIIGFADQTRGTSTPVPGGDSTLVIIRGITETRPVNSAKPTLYKTLQDFVANAPAGEIQSIAETAGLGAQQGDTWVRWVLVQTALNPNIFTLDDNEPDYTLATIPLATTTKMVDRGFLSGDVYPPIAPGELTWSITWATNPWFRPEFDGVTLDAYDIVNAVKPGTVLAAAYVKFINSALLRGGNAYLILDADEKEVAAGKPVLGIPGLTWSDIGGQAPWPT